MLKKIEKVVALCVATLLLLTVTVSGTVAFLVTETQSQDTVTAGAVRIDQLEFERVDQSALTLQPFTKHKPMYPSHGTANAVTQISWDTVGVNSTDLLYDEGLRGVVDKFIFVENTGNRDAYLRTWFAFEEGSYNASVLDSVIHLNVNDQAWTFGPSYAGIEINGNTYTILYADYNGLLAPDTVSQPSLLQVYMDSQATNETVQALDGNGNGKYEILVVTQAADEDRRDTLFSMHPFDRITVNAD